MTYNESIDNMEFDVRNNILSNLFWFLMIGIAVLFLILGLRIVANMPEGYEKVMALIFTMFMSFKVMSWVGHPKLIFKDKKKGHHKTLVHGY